MQYMPEGIVSYDHAETVNALAQGDVAMITEWSAFYPTLTNPETSTIGDCLAIAPEPKGPAGRKPALGGFLRGRDARGRRREGGRLAADPVADLKGERPAVRRGGRRVGAAVGLRDPGGA